MTLEVLNLPVATLLLVVKREITIADLRKSQLPQRLLSGWVLFFESMFSGGDISLNLYSSLGIVLENQNTDVFKAMLGE